MPINCFDNEKELIEGFRQSQVYKEFKSKFLQHKIDREKAAWQVLNENRGQYTIQILNHIFDTVDQNQQNKKRWFGSLLAAPNRNLIFGTEISLINQWIDQLLFSGQEAEISLNACLKKYKIKGASKGLATLLLYLSNPDRYNIWVNSTQNGLSLLGRIADLKGQDWGENYTKFNNAAIEFRKKLELLHQEVDWVLSNLVCNAKKAYNHFAAPGQTPTFQTDLQTSLVRETLTERNKNVNDNDELEFETPIKEEGEAIEVPPEKRKIYFVKGAKMKTGIRPRVNEAREFLEIAKDFKDPKEIIREALSNSWDARATKVSLKFDLQRIRHSRGKKLMVEIYDDGDGMSAEPRQEIGTSEIEDFFNLGDSNKSYGCIGTKGHGTKIYYKSDGIVVETWKNGKYLKAEMEVNPWESLSKGIVPTYRTDEKELEGKGTRILIDGFLGKQKDFDSADQLIQYILWYSVIGSFGQYFGNPKKMDVELKPANYPTFISIPFGFNFPDENIDLSETSDNFCKLFGPKKIECGHTESGKKVEVEIIGAVLGESKRDFIPHTYDMSGLWLCKDYIKIERANTYIEEVIKGQYWYRTFLIFANCQQFDLTANRNNVRTEDEEYRLAIEGIRSFIKEINDNQYTKDYFEKNKKEKEKKDQEKKEKEQNERLSNKKNEIEDRINRYKGRADLVTTIGGTPIKEPIYEVETALVLQAMITAQHLGIDFRIGEYNINIGTDLLVEYKSKGIPSYAWVELVQKLSNLFAWLHPPEGIHKIICWELGDTKEKQNFQDGREARLTKKAKGRYNLDIGSDTLDVYVLKEIL